MLVINDINKNIVSLLLRILTLDVDWMQPGL